MKKVERLDKVLSNAGIGSRKEVAALVKAGRVTMDGQIVQDRGMRVVRGASIIQVDGQPVRQHALTLMLHKPTGFITATNDPRHPTVLDLLSEPLPRGLFPAGRLDKDTEGFVLLTEDGQLGHRLTSPKHGIEKEYVADVIGQVPADIGARFAAGILLSDGITRPARCHLAPSDDGKESRLHVIVKEGKHHQVRRMLAACDLTVTRLKRIRIGGVHLDPDLAPGDYRELTPEEIKQLLINH